MERQSRAQFTADYKAQARTDPGAGSLVGTGGTRLLRLPCRAHQLQASRRIPLSCRFPLATHSTGS